MDIICNRLSKSLDIDCLNMVRNCIENLSVDNLDTPIYRYYQANNLIRVFGDKENVLVNPSYWDDPYENMILKLKVRTEDNINVGFDLIANSIFAQCWSLNNNETDALWRIYSFNNKGVRVKTTIRKLITSFLEAHKEPKDACKRALNFLRIGSIKYYPEDEIINAFEEINSNTKTPVNIDVFTRTRNLLIKRKEFEHEKEIRLIFWPTTDPEDIKKNKEYFNIDYKKKICSYKIDPNDLFDEILFDSRLSQKCYGCYSELLRDFGYKKEIKRSTLYDPFDPNIEVIIG